MFHNLAIGLFGGSFNPPHEGHLLVAQIALHYLNLNQIWWLVTPGNPLKQKNILKPTAERVRLSQSLTQHPLIHVTSLEEDLGTVQSADTIAALLKLYPSTHFVWIMGADNLLHFHHWHNWRWIVEHIPIAIINRPGSSHAETDSLMAKHFAHCRIPEQEASTLALRTPPAWTFLHGPLSFQSSSLLRHCKSQSKS